MKSKILFFSIAKVICSVFLTVWGHIALANTGSGWVETDVSRSRLVFAGPEKAGSEKLLIGLQVQLKEGWKTYWRNPGDSGIPPKFNWQGSENIARVKVNWPIPENFESFGFRTWGYDREVIFPVIITPKKPSEAVNVQLQFAFGVCADVCIPFEQTFSLAIPHQAKANNDDRDQVLNYLKISPTPLKNSNKVDAITARAIDSEQFELKLQSSTTLSDPIVILEGEDGDVFTVREVSIGASHQQARFIIAADTDRKSPSLSGRVLFATVFDKDWAVETVVSID
ncbi:protein-disulfide reductase DsbD domain-containing protein [Sneathiella glossodoripedis]|uniref:protein-disulfide reductase DsbD domain-containing protein n=1 Tax=Sneathiella glossodoripedis TaxID=418853 RepID=UPI00046F6001|nr:protein-disulfide reductase DsbD domain-containing protein [Sneathiella glossodoripedis]